MTREPAGYWNRDGSTHRPIAVIVRTWQLIGVRSAHEPSTLSNSHKSRMDFTLIHQDHGLAAAAPVRCSQASGDSIKTDLQTLDLFALLVGPRTFVGRSSEEAAGFGYSPQFASMQRREHRADLSGRGRRIARSVALA